MKTRISIPILLALALSLVFVSVALAFSVGNIDGAWGWIDGVAENSSSGTLGGGATCSRWATGPGDVPTAWHNYTTTVQTGATTDENQVRYGRDAYKDGSGNWQSRSCTNTTFAEQSGFGFDGNDGPISPAANTPFYLGKFTHYNNQVYASGDGGSGSNPFGYVDLTTVVPVTCNDGTTATNFSFSNRFTLDETSNTAGTCVYPGSSVCPDKVTVTPATTASFTCPDGQYTVNILGFTTQGLGGGACDQSYNSAAVATEYITEEDQDNVACLWAEISAPTADIYPTKSCMDFNTGTPYYRIVTKNAGPGAGVATRITDTLPAGVIFSSYTSKLTTSSGTVNQGACTYNSGTKKLTCQLLTSLPPTTVDASAKWTVDVYVTFNGTPAANTVTAGMDTRTDPVPGNNSSTVSCTPTSATVIGLTATPGNNGIKLAWRTISEVNNMGFNVYRAPSLNGKKTKLNAALLPSLVYPGGPLGASYSFNDPISKKATYFYWVEDVSFSGYKTLHGPVKAALVKGPGANAGDALAAATDQ